MAPQRATWGSEKRLKRERKIIVIGSNFCKTQVETTLLVSGNNLEDVANVDHGGDGDADEEEVERSHHVRHIWVRHVETLTFKSIEVISGQGIYYQIGVSMLMVDVISRQDRGCISCGILVSGIRARGVSSEHVEKWRCFPVLQLRCALILREPNQIFIACLFKGSKKQSFFLQTLLFTAFLVTVLKMLTYALVST